MPARIRLQVKGHPANRFFWIVASSSKTNPHGRPIERMGYWFPDVKGIYDNRSIVLNRPRLKYWIGLGAEISSGAYRVLSQANFLPKKPPPFGYSRLYDHANFIPCPEPPSAPERDLGAAEDLKEQIEEIDRQNLLRKQSYEENAHRQFSVRDSQPPDEEIREYMQKYYLLLEQLEKLMPSTPANKVQAFMSMMSVLNSNGSETDNLSDRGFSLKPQYVAKKLNISYEKAEKIIRVYGNSGLDFEQADLDDHTVNMAKKKRVKKFKPGDKVYVPSENPITPYPNFEDEVDVFPKDFHNIRNPLRPSKEYGVRLDPDKDIEETRSYKRNKEPRMFMWGGSEKKLHKKLLKK